MANLPDRIADKIAPEPNTGCWLWTGAVGAGGYANVFVGGRYLNAHRVVYEALVSPIPNGLQIDHRCGVRSCVNPAHLEPVTSRENLLRRNYRKAVCLRGHDRTGESSVNKRRACKACASEYRKVA